MSYSGTKYKGNPHGDGTKTKENETETEIRIVGNASSYPWSLCHERRASHDVRVCRTASRSVSSRR